MNEERITFSTLLTITRIVMTPVVVHAMIKGQWVAGAGLFAVAAITDALDGHLARFLGEETALGAYLDPVADKVLLLASFTALSLVRGSFFVLPFWFVYLIWFKEIVLLGGGYFLYLLCGDMTIRPTWLSKCTTVAQILFVFFLLVSYAHAWVPNKMYQGVLVVVTTMVCATLVQYVRMATRFFGFAGNN